MEKAQHDSLYIEILDDEHFLKWILYPSEELDEYWNKIMQEDTDKKKVISDLETIIKGLEIVEEELSAEAKKDIWNKIEGGKKKKHPFRLFSLLKYTAVVLVLIVSSVYLYTTFRTPSGQPINYESLISTALPIEENPENVLIVLGNKEKIEVKESNVELIHDTDGRISVNSEIHDNKHTSDNVGNNMNQLYVPFGKTTSIVMSDGSKVWVNSGTRLIYPSTFTGDKREIYVEGEIYLEVSRNEKMPFIVRTDMLEINVLGTSFNVSAYKNDIDQSVVLATGSVSVKETSQKASATIKPNQKFTIEKSTKKSNLQEVDVFDYICWKYGFLIFENELLSNVLNKIERYYNVSLVYDPSETDKTTVSGKLDLKEDIKETFRIVSITTPIDYTIQEREIHISVKP